MIVVMNSFKVILENRETTVVIDRMHDFSELDLQTSNLLLVTDETMANSTASIELMNAGIRSVVIREGRG